MLGFETSDDAAVYKLNNEQAAILTLDFLTPIVDDPYQFGRIAAANALSDVFAMGATPLCALNIVALSPSLGNNVASAILQGGLDAVNEAGAVLVGGHSIDDAEPKYGLAVLGIAHPSRIIRNAGAQPGDALYLTKPLGTGILGQAFRKGHIDQAAFEPAIESMMQLNAAGSRAMQAAHAHAGTDVTGFALAGHLHEMLQASKVGARLNWNAIPLLPRVWDLCCKGILPGRCATVIDFSRSFIDAGTLDTQTLQRRLGVLCDPQTSGGLLVAVDERNTARFEAAFRAETGVSPARIGTCIEDETCSIHFADA